MNRVRAFLLGLLGVFASVLAVYAKGRQAGKKAEEAKALKKDVAAEKAKNETLEDVVEVRDDIGRLSDDSVEQRLRDKYQRD